MLPWPTGCLELCDTLVAWVWSRWPRAQAMLDARPAVERRMAGERLVVDREALPQAPRSSSPSDGAPIKVLLVRGGPRTGKTWSRHLFERAARDRGADVVYLRGAMVPTVEAVVEKLFEVRALRLGSPRATPRRRLVPHGLLPPARPWPSAGPAAVDRRGRPRSRAPTASPRSSTPIPVLRPARRSPSTTPRPTGGCGSCSSTTPTATRRPGGTRTSGRRTATRPEAVHRGARRRRVPRMARRPPGDPARRPHRGARRRRHRPGRRRPASGGRPGEVATAGCAESTTRCTPSWPHSPEVTGS